MDFLVKSIIVMTFAALAGMLIGMASARHLDHARIWRRQFIVGRVLAITSRSGEAMAMECLGFKTKTHGITDLPSSARVSLDRLDRCLGA